MQAEIKVQGDTIYVLNAKGVNRWSANVQPGHDDDGKRISEDERRSIAKWLASRAASPLLAALPERGWRDLSTAPKDGTVVRLLVNFTNNQLTDSDEPQATIGGNTFSNTGEDDEWLFAGWNWEQDRFTQGEGKAIAWMPLLDTSTTAAAPTDAVSELKQCVSMLEARGQRISLLEFLLTRARSNMHPVRGLLDQIDAALASAQAVPPVAPTDEDLEALLPFPNYHDGMGQAPDMWTKKQILGVVRAALKGNAS